MPTFITSVKLLAATEKDYVKLSQEMEKKSFHPTTITRTVGHHDEIAPIVFNCSTKKSLIDASTAISAAASTTGKKFSFTIFKDKARSEP